MKRTARLVWSGVLGAMALVFLLLTVFPFATIALPAVASVCLLPIVIECGRRWALATYAATAVLALLITPDMEAKLLFVAFFGYYPIVKSFLETRLSRSMEWVCKFVVFNVAVVAAYLVLSSIGFSLDEFAIQGLAVPLGAVLAAFLVAGNVVFLLYDRTLSLMVPLYFSRLRPLFLRMFH